MNIDKSDTGIIISIEEIEERILLDLARQLTDLARPATAAEAGNDPLDDIVGIDNTATKPTDPVQARLFPDAYRDDPDAALEFRRFTERTFRQEKLDRIGRVLAHISAAEQVGDERNVVVKDDLWNDWVAFLNDLRLALGTKLDLDPTGKRKKGKQSQGLYDLYDWLTWMQESLIERGYFGFEDVED